MKRIFILVIILLFNGCHQKIDLSKFEGYYEYFKIDPDKRTVMDTIRTKAIFSNLAADGLPIIQIDILDDVFLSDSSLQSLWNLEEHNENLLQHNSLLINT